MASLSARDAKGATSIFAKASFAATKESKVIRANPSRDSSVNDSSTRVHAPPSGAAVSALVRALRAERTITCVASHSGITAIG